LKEPKVVFRAVRFTKTADELIERLCNVCNKSNFKINGESEINPTILLGYFFEKLSHQRDSRSEDLLKFLNTIDVRNQYGKELDILSVRVILREINDKENYIDN